MCRILVVDDNLEQLNLRRLLLEQVGHQVAVAWSVSETMRLSATHREGENHAEQNSCDCRNRDCHRRADPVK